jgi:hypothetical protein
MHGSFNPILQSSCKKLLVRSNTAQGACAFLAFAPALKRVFVRYEDGDNVNWCLVLVAAVVFREWSVLACT